jgi:formylglycine-generating enzyme required for sulfatase activity
MQTCPLMPGVLLALAWLSFALSGCGGGGAPDQGFAGSACTPEPITTPLGVEMVLIPAGEFLMGDDPAAGGPQAMAPQPAHRVRISAFYMDTSEVTQESFRRLMGRNPSKFQGPDRPVERVSWYDATQYCNARSLREGLQPCYDRETLECDFHADGYRLPTEAEWEYACRSGSTTRWSFGNDAARLGRYAWFKENAAKTTHPVKQKRPNAWGLYDMHGNVWEWCNDFFGKKYLGKDPEQDPRGPGSGQERVLRGGSWATSAESCRSASRSSETPRFADACFGTEAYGFRCVRAAGIAGQ